MRSMRAVVWWPRVAHELRTARGAWLISALSVCACWSKEAPDLFQEVGFSSASPTPDAGGSAPQAAGPRASEAPPQNGEVSAATPLSPATPPIQPPSRSDAGAPSGVVPAPLTPPPVAKPVPLVGEVFTDPASQCAFPETEQLDATLFSGSFDGTTCRPNLDAPYQTFWYRYQDSSTALLSQGVSAPGCSATSCSLHVQGPAAGSEGFSSYGAGVGFPLVSSDTPIDASRFVGIQYWARGTILGTRGPAATDVPQTVFMRVVTSTNRSGDEFGAYCHVDPLSWTLCRQRFSELGRDGYVAAPDPATDVLSLQALVRIEFEFRLFRSPDGSVPVPVSVDAEISSISFF